MTLVLEDLVQLDGGFLLPAVGSNPIPKEGRVLASDAFGNALWSPSDSVASPSDHDFVGWNLRPTERQGTITPTVGQVYVSKIECMRAATLARISFLISTAGAAGTPNYRFGIYRITSATVATGILLSSAHETGIAGTNTQYTANLALVSGQSASVERGEDVFAAMGVFTASTTAAIFHASTLTTGVLNWGLVQATYRTGRFTSAGPAMPATFNPSTLTDSGGPLLAVKV